jgi:hypothetical protein
MRRCLLRQLKQEAHCSAICRRPPIRADHLRWARVEPKVWDSSGRAGWRMPVSGMGRAPPPKRPAPALALQSALPKRGLSQPALQDIAEPIATRIPCPSYRLAPGAIRTPPATLRLLAAEGGRARHTCDGGRGSWRAWAGAFSTLIIRHHREAAPFRVEHSLRAGGRLPHRGWAGHDLVRARPGRDPRPPGGAGRPRPLRR